MDQQIIFSIKEASSLLKISDHTLRKYESDYSLKIPRNEKGHRYYTEQEIEVFKRILDWKEKGFTKDTINQLLEKNVDAIDQKEQALELITLDRLTGADIKELLVNVITEREKELEEKFERKLQEEVEKARNQITDEIQNENTKLMDYIAVTRQKEKEEQEKKKGFWSKLFSKDT